jgi:S1-C subfamily serine protease
VPHGRGRDADTSHPPPPQTASVPPRPAKKGGGKAGKAGGKGGGGAAPPPPAPAPPLQQPFAQAPPLQAPSTPPPPRGPFAPAPLPRPSVVSAAADEDDAFLPVRGASREASPSSSSSSYLADEEDDEEVAAAAAAAGLPPASAPFMDAVVKVFCVHTEPNFSMPWQRKRQFASTSTGFMVAGPAGERWLLTNAHSVEYGTQIKVKRRGDDTKFLATVLASGTECDIALLSVEDPTFWEGATPLTLGGLPRLQDHVAVVGFPIGGDSISITSGVISRIEVTSYVHGSSELLGIQTSAAINSGNSGGPAFNAAGECVGIAFQSMAGSDAEGIGYVIPTPIIHHFLSDYVRHGVVTGFPVLGIKWQRLESAALRSAYGLGPRDKGVLVRSVAPTAAAAGVLRPDDVITAFDGVPVANDGTVLFRTGERIAFGHLISQKFTGERAAVTVVRGGEPKKTLDVTLSPPAPLVPAHLGGADPDYLVVAGAVFTPASEPYLASEYGGDYLSDSPVKLLDKLLHGWRASPGEQVVVLSQVLACDEALGYEDLCNVQVLRCNGVAVHNLAHLASLVAAADVGSGGDGGDKNGRSFLRFDLEYDEVVVLDAGRARAATEAILAQHSIPAAVSAGLAATLREAGSPVWPEGPGGGSGGGEKGGGDAPASATVPISSPTATPA